MKKTLSKVLALVLAVVLAIPAYTIPVKAATIWDNVSETHYASRYTSYYYTYGKFYDNMTKIPLTGDGARDVVAIAASQMGYLESDSSAGQDGVTGGSSNMTEYGAYTNVNGAAWCASFCSWVMYAAEVTDTRGTESYMARNGYYWSECYVPYWSNMLYNNGRYRFSDYYRYSYNSAQASYIPQPGDLIFFTAGYEPLDEGHIGLVAFSDGTYVYTLEGNTSSQDGVESEGGGAFFKKYALSSSAIAGYGILPYETVYGLPEIDYTGNNPTPGLYVTTSGPVGVYYDIEDTTPSWTLPMSSVFEVLDIAYDSSGDQMLYAKCQINGETVYGWIVNGNTSNGYTRTFQIYASPTAYDDSNDQNHDGIPDSYNHTVGSDGSYSFENAYGHEFYINDVNGVIDGEDATLITNSTSYANCNPNWAISVQLRPTGNDGEYKVVKVVECPGSANAAGITFVDGDVVMVVHSAGSYPGYSNWMDKVAALALEEGDIVNLSSNNKYVTVPSINDSEEPETPVDPEPTPDPEPETPVDPEPTPDPEPETPVEPETELIVPDTSVDTNGDGIPDCFGPTADEKGYYTFDNAYGFVFDVDYTNGTIAGEDITIVTSSSYYSNCNPNWAISVQLRPTGNTNQYEVVKVVVTPGSASAAGISWESGDIVLVVHSASSDPSDGYANWMSKVAAMALNAGDIVAVASDKSTVTVMQEVVVETPDPEPEAPDPEPETPVDPEPTPDPEPETELIVPDTSVDTNGDGIPDCFVATTNEQGYYTFDNAYGFVFDVDYTNGTIAGEDITIVTSSSYYSNCNPNWAISVQLRPTGNTNQYEVVKVVVTPGSASIAGISWESGDIVLVVHSASSRPSDGYANWMSKVAAMALNAGDIVAVASDKSTVTVMQEVVVETPDPEPETPVEPEPTPDPEPETPQEEPITSGKLTYANGYDWSDSEFYLENIMVFASSDSTATVASMLGSACFGWGNGMVLEYNSTNGTWVVTSVDLTLGDDNTTEYVTLGANKMVIIFYNGAPDADFFLKNAVVGKELYLNGTFSRLQSTTGTLSGVSLATGIVESELGDVPDYGGAIPGAGLQGYTNNVYYGCDISFWNLDDTSYAYGSTLDDSGANYSLVDFAKMKADGCDFVILRIGSVDSSGKYYDPHFVTLYNMARAAGMDIGLYFYSTALTYAEAAAEAEFIINVIESYGMYFEYPLYIDIEESDQLALGTIGLNNLCYGWCDTMINAGYFPGIYGNYNLYEQLSYEVISNYDFWLAYVSSSTSMSSYNPSNMNVSDECSMWQYSFYGYEYNGIGKDMLDVNVSYKDYASIMKNGGYNNVK